MRVKTLLRCPSRPEKPQVLPRGQLPPHLPARTRDTCLQAVHNASEQNASESVCFSTSYQGSTRASLSPFPNLKNGALLPQRASCCKDAGPAPP